jgi:hypothetical protein
MQTLCFRSLNCFFFAPLIQTKSTNLKLWKITGCVGQYKIFPHSWKFVWMTHHHPHSKKKKSNFTQKVWKTVYVHCKYEYFSNKLSHTWMKKQSLHQTRGKITQTLRYLELNQNLTWQRDLRLTFKNSIYRTSVPLPSKMLHFIYFFNKYKYWVF